MAPVRRISSPITQTVVMAGLVPAIHVFGCVQDVDTRHSPGMTMLVEKAPSLTKT
jgi:hypothetical protein